MCRSRPGPQLSVPQIVEATPSSHWRYGVTNNKQNDVGTVLTSEAREAFGIQGINCGEVGRAYDKEFDGYYAWPNRA